MKEPSIKFTEYLKTIKFNTPSFPVISNYYPSLCNDPNESARRDPVVQAAMKSILARMTQEHDRASAGIAPHTVEVSPVNFLQDVMDDLGDPQIRDREREEQ